MGSNFFRRKALAVIVKLTLLLALVFIVLQSTSVVHGQTIINATVNSPQLKMRAAPSLKAQIITYLARNLAVTVDGRNRALNWVHVVIPGGMTGWVYRTYLKFPRGANLRQLPVLDGSGGGTPAPDQSPITASFITQSQYLDQTGKVTVNWNIVGNPFAGVEVRINGASEWHGFSNLPPSGSLTIDLKPYITRYTGPIYYADFSLHYGNDARGQAMWQTIHVECPPSVFFRNGSDLMLCPLTGAQSVQAAYQSFERGFMVWRGDNKEFYVLLNNGSMDYWGPGSTGPNQPLPSSQIPAGLSQPVSGFGKLWDNFVWLQSDIGWATAAESGYVTTLRETYQSTVTPYPWAGRVLLTLPNGRLISISRYGSNVWSYVD